MVPFLVGKDIENIDLLFGRDNQIKELIGYAKRRENVGIIGSRRFGKTCLLKSMRTFFNNNPQYEAYTLYFDAKTHGCIKKDTDAVYRKITAMLVSQMCEDKIVNNGLFNIARRCDLDISCDRIDLEEQMRKWSSERQRDVLFTFVDLIGSKGKYLLLFIDEIEYLLLEAFEEPTDFSRIRGYASNSRFLNYWIAGTASWSSICSQIGSAELNGGVHSIPLYPLSREDFSKMWNYECNLIKDDNQKHRLIGLLDFVYNKTGGIPFYSKYVGSYLLNRHDSKDLPSYQILRDYLREVFNNRFHTQSEKKALVLLARAPIENGQTVPDGITGLLEKGLAILESNCYRISNEYLKDYILAVENDKSILDSSSVSCERNIDKSVNEDSAKTPIPLQQAESIHTLVDEIARLRDNINKIWNDCQIWQKERSDNEKYPPFTASTEDYSEFLKLKKICTDESSYGAFASALYKLYYEGSHKGWNLPIGFVAITRSNICSLSKNIHPNETESQFAKMVLANRHMYEHRDYRPSKIQMPTIDLLNIINNGKLPVSTQDFQRMQMNMLQECRKELFRMYNYLKNL